MSTLRNWTGRLANFRHDFRRGIVTGGTMLAVQPGHIYYATVRYSCTQEILRKLSLKRKDTFIDVGCGKGRVVCLASELNVAEVIGIEYSPSLAAIARKNIASERMRRSPARIVCGNAEGADYTKATVLYFFNPFEHWILDRVLHRVRSDRLNKEVRMAFVMESTKHREIFGRHDWLVCYDRFRDEDEHEVAFYRSRIH